MFLLYDCRDKGIGSVSHGVRLGEGIYATALHCIESPEKPLTVGDTFDVLLGPHEFHATVVKVPHKRTCGTSGFQDAPVILATSEDTTASSVASFIRGFKEGGRFGAVAAGPVAGAFLTADGPNRLADAWGWVAHPQASAFRAGNSGMAYCVGQGRIAVHAGGHGFGYLGLGPGLIRWTCQSHGVASWLHSYLPTQVFGVRSFDPFDALRAWASQAGAFPGAVPKR